MDEKTIEEQYAEYADFMANDPEEKEYQEAKKERRVKNQNSKIMQKTLL